MRTTSHSGKRERLEARITPEQKELVQRAASLEGRSVTDFIIETVEAAAQKVIRSHQVLQLTDRETQAFFAALESPPRPSDELREAARRYREFIGQ